MRGYEREFDVPFRPSRSAQFTPQQRWALLVEFDQCVERGSKSAFCRRVGVDPWTMRDWVRKRADGRITDPGERPSAMVSRGVVNREERDELRRLRHENERLRRELAQSQAAADILGKAAAFLEGLAKNAEPEPPEPSPGMPAWLRDRDTSSLPPIPSQRWKPRE